MSPRFHTLPAAPPFPVWTERHLYAIQNAMSLTVNQKLREHVILNAFAPMMYREHIRPAANPVQRSCLINPRPEISRQCGIPQREIVIVSPKEQARALSCTMNTQTIVFYQRTWLYRTHFCQRNFMSGRLSAVSISPGASGGDEQ